MALQAPRPFAWHGSGLCEMVWQLRSARLETVAKTISGRLFEIIFIRHCQDHPLGPSDKSQDNMPFMYCLITVVGCVCHECVVAKRARADLRRDGSIGVSGGLREASRGKDSLCPMTSVANIVHIQGLEREESGTNQ
jgi:hypothetical protein